MGVISIDKNTHIRKKYDSNSLIVFIKNTNIETNKENILITDMKKTGLHTGIHFLIKMNSLFLKKFIQVY